VVAETVVDVPGQPVALGGGGQVGQRGGGALLALAAPLPDTVLISALHVLVGATLVWLSVTLRTNDRQFSTERVMAMERM
jgi:hypothetical protein